MGNSFQDGYPKTFTEDKSYEESAYSVRGEGIKCYAGFCCHFLL